MRQNCPARSMSSKASFEGRYSSTGSPWTGSPQITFNVLFPLHLCPLSHSSPLHETHKPSFAIHEHALLLHGPLYPDSILFHDWEVLLVLPDNQVSLSIVAGRSYKCLFQDGSSSRASPSIFLQSGTPPTFRCRMPFSVRRLHPFFTPASSRHGVVGAPVRRGEERQKVRGRQEGSGRGCGGERGSV